MSGAHSNRRARTGWSAARAAGGQDAGQNRDDHGPDADRATIPGWTTVGISWK